MLQPDKINEFEIINLGTTTFTVSNTSDGTSKSHNHSVQIVVALNAAKAGSNNFQLSFYSSTDNIKQAANFSDGVLNIYYPIELYDAMRMKLEQAFAAKKKVTVKVVQKQNGYNEGTLVL